MDTSAVPRSTQISTVVDHSCVWKQPEVPRSTQISTVVDRSSAARKLRCSKEYTNFYCCRSRLFPLHQPVPRSTQISTVVDYSTFVVWYSVPRSTQISTVVDTADTRPKVAFQGVHKFLLL